MTRKCDQCGKEFATDGALLQHYSAKHPEITPPKQVIRRERERERKGSAGKLQSRKNVKIIAAAIVILIVIVAGVAVYSIYGSHSSNDTAVSTTSHPTVGILSGDEAPALQITLANSSTTNLTQFRGNVVLLWFVATWCSSCTQGAQMLNQQYYQELHSKGVTILVVELYNDLNQPGPSIQQFADQYGGGTGKPGWLYGTTTQGGSYTYDPNADLDVYYLLNQNGIILTSGVGLPNSLPSVVAAA